jgi:NADH-quinone oxidoreductase subunit C
MTTVVKGSDLAEVLGRRFLHSVTDSDASSVWVTPESVLEVCRFLHDDSAQRYDLLSSLTAVDYVEFFDVVYHLTSISRNASAVLKARVYGREAPSLASVTGVWLGAELQEREVFDLLGVSFHDHPNLKRMLTWEGFQGHPLRRDYLEPPLPYTWPHGG